MNFKQILKKDFSKSRENMKKFEQKIKTFYQKANENNKVTKESGYLMEKAIYDDLKNKLEEIKEIYKGPDVINIKPGEQAIFKDYHDLENELLNGKEYIIVDKTIWKLLSNNKLDEGQGIMRYEINSQNLILSLNDTDKAFFKHNLNIINHINLIKEDKKENNGENIKKDSKEVENRKPSSNQINKEDKEFDNYKKNIIILLDIYYFSLEMKEQIEQASKKDIKSNYLMECYLIKEDWFTKNNYLNIYNKIYKYLNGKQENKIKDKKFILEDLYKNKEFNFNENLDGKIEESKINDLELFKIDLNIDDNNRNVFPNKYIIINKEILNNITQNNFWSDSIKSLDLCIYKDNIIIQYLEQNILFIGKINESIYNQFYPKLILKYEDKTQMEKIFDNIKNNDYSMIDKYLYIYKEKGINDLFDEKDKNKKIGTLFLIDENKLNKQIEIIGTILSNLNYNFEEPKFNENEEYYLINKNYIKKLKELFKFNDYLKLIEEKNLKEFNNKEQINKIISENKSLFDIDINKIKKELNSTDCLKLKIESLNNTNNSYFLEFEIITHKLKEYITDYDLIPKDIEIIEANCSQRDNKVIIIPRISEKFYIYIYIINDHNEYIIEKIYDFIDKNGLDKYKNISIYSKFKFDNGEIFDEDGKKCGTYYDFIKKEENEIVVNNIKIKDDILNMIKIYLFNKDLNAKIKISKEEDKEKNIHVEKCLLIDKENMDLFKKYYSYKSFEKHINDNINNIKIEKNIQGNYYSNDNMHIIYESLKNNNYFEKYEKKDLFPIDKKMFDIKKVNLTRENDVYHYDEFIIVNNDIFKENIEKLKLDIEEREYIINSGKIIIIFKEDKDFQLLIGECNLNCIKLELLISFKDEMKLDEFKINLSKKKYSFMIENLIEQNKTNEIASVYELLDNYLEKIRHLVIIYLRIEKLKKIIKESKFNDEQDYYIINNRWIECLNNSFDYDKIIQKIKENDEFNNYEKEFIKIGINNEENKAEGKKNVAKNNAGLLKKIIINVFRKEKFDKINNDNSKANSLELEINPEIQKLNLDNSDFSFYDKFSIINGFIKKSLFAIFKIKSEEKIFIPMKYLTYQSNFYIFYTLKNHYLINVGNFSEDLIYNTNMIVDIKSEKIHKDIIQNDNFKKDIQISIDELKSDKSKDDKKIIISKDVEIGTIYKIVKNNNKSLNILKQKISIKKILKQEKKENNLERLIDLNKDNKLIKKLKDENIRDFILDKNKKVQFNKNDSEFIEKKVKNKMIKLIIILYINYKKIEKNIAKNIKEKEKIKYYLINKDFMKIYKNYYEFDKIIESLNSKIDENKFDYYSNEIISCIEKGINYDENIYELIKTLTNDSLDSLENKKKEQDELIMNLEKNSLNKKNNIIYPIEQLKYIIKNNNFLLYYGENEIIYEEFFKLFNDIETPELKKLIQKEKVDIICGEDNIYIISECININKYPSLTIGHYENFIFKPFLLIYYKNNDYFTSFLSNLELWGYKEFIKNYNIEKNNVSLIKDDTQNNDIIGKICKLPLIYENNIIQNNKDENTDKSNIEKNEEKPKINSGSMKLLKLIIFLKKIEIDKKSSLKNKELDIGYAVKINFLENIQKLKAYKIINDYINNNININDILYKIKINENNCIDSLSKLVLNEFHKNILEEINLNQELINIYSNYYDISKEYLNLNAKKFNYVYYINNFILLNEEIFNLFKNSRLSNFDKEKFLYFAGDNRIFILSNDFKNKYSLFTYLSKNNYLQELDLILYFNRDAKSELNYIKEEGFSKFSDYLLFNKDLVSPIFDIDQNIIGTAYKYNPEVKNYTDLNINFDIKKMFLLYLNYQKLKKKLSIEKGPKKNEFKEYYILNKDWLNIYKTYYNFDLISKEFEKSSIIQQIFNNLNVDEQISDKKLTLMIKALPKKIIDNFNNSELLFNTNYKNLNKKFPQILGFDYLDNNNKTKTLFYSYDFEIIDENIYDELFKNLKIDISSVTDRDVRNFLIEEQSEKKEERVQCLFENDKIIIRFKDKSPDTGNKYIIYIGKLNNSYIFEPDIFFLYDFSYNFKVDDHINFILSYGGFYKYFKQLQKLSNNTFELKYNNQICGIAIKRSMNQMAMINQDIIINNNLNNIPPNDNQINIQSLENRNQNQNISKNGSIRNSLINKNDDNQVDNNEIKNIKSIKEFFYYVPKIGLTNIGATCYMNATLQCLCQIEEFASFFKYDNYVNIVSKKYEYKRENCLTSSFKILIEKLWPSFSSRESYYSPHEFRQKISDMSPLFQNVGANDAKDLVNFIIMTLHEELNRNLSPTNSNNNNPFNNMNYDRILTYNLFLQDYNRTFKSKISEIFYAITETETKCLNCFKIQYNCQAYFFLVFPLEEVKKYSINKLNNQSTYNNNMNNMNMNNFNNISLNNNNINMNFNINFNMNNIPESINNMNPNINNSNRNYHRRANSMDLYNKNRNMIMNSNMSNMMMNAGNNLIMNQNNYLMQNNNNIFNSMMPNQNYNMMSNMGMNFIKSNSGNMLNNYNNYNMMNNNSFNSMPINNPITQPNFNNNYGFGITPNINNMRNMNNFNSMNSNLSNITMNNMFNMGMNNNINNANNINKNYIKI